LTFPIFFSSNIFLANCRASSVDKFESSAFSFVKNPSPVKALVISVIGSRKKKKKKKKKEKKKKR